MAERRLAAGFRRDFLGKAEFNSSLQFLLSPNLFLDTGENVAIMITPALRNFNAGVILFKVPGMGPFPVGGDGHFSQRLKQQGGLKGRILTLPPSNERTPLPGPLPASRGYLFSANRS